MSQINTPMVVIYSSFDCSHLFVSSEIDSSNAYPTQVIYYCPVCERQHSYNVKSSHVINTPLRKHAFKQYCLHVGIVDFDVYVI